MGGAVNQSSGFFPFFAYKCGFDFSPMTVLSTGLACTVSSGLLAHKGICLSSI